MRVKIKKFKELCDYFGHIISDKLPELIRKRIKKHPQVESVVLKDRGHYTMAAVYQLSTNQKFDISELESFINEDESIKNLVQNQSIEIVEKL